MNLLRRFQARLVWQQALGQSTDGHCLLPHRRKCLVAEAELSREAVQEEPVRTAPRKLEELSWVPVEQEDPDALARAEFH